MSSSKEQNEQAVDRKGKRPLEVEEEAQDVDKKGKRSLEVKDLTATQKWKRESEPIALSNPLTSNHYLRLLLENRETQHQLLETLLEYHNRNGVNALLSDDDLKKFLQILDVGVSPRELLQAIKIIWKRRRLTIDAIKEALKAEKEEKINAEKEEDDTPELDPLQEFVNIDFNVTDPQFCATISPDIYKHLHESEAKTRPSTDFMEKVQTDVNEEMRAKLISWLAEVAENFGFVPETLHLAVNYLDRFLSKQVINQKQSQLLGVSCLRIAEKHEETHSTTGEDEDEDEDEDKDKNKHRNKVEELCNVTANTYTKEEVVDMESEVLMGFEITVPTAQSFLKRFVQASQESNEVPSPKLECLANYILELSLLEYNMLSYAPSLVAASATFLANFILYPSKKPWNYTLECCTSYQAQNLSDCVKALHHLFCKGDHPYFSAIKHKYSQDQHKNVAKMQCPSSIPAEIFMT